MTDYTLASPSGLRAAFGFGVALGVAIGVSVYVLLTKPLARRPETGRWRVRPPVAVALASVVSVPVLVAWAMSMAGFHGLTLGARDVRLDYVLPERSVTLPYASVERVVRRPAYKSQWRLQIHMKSGRVVESAPGAHEAVTAAAEALERRLASER